MWACAAVLLATFQLQLCKHRNGNKNCTSARLRQAQSTMRTIENVDERMGLDVATPRQAKLSAKHH